MSAGGEAPAGIVAGVVSPVPAEVVLARLSPDERVWLDQLAAGLLELLGDRLADLRLFGSKVRGDWHDESDIDVLVLVHGLDWDTWLAVIDLAALVSPWFGPVVEDYDRYHEPRSRARGFYKELRVESVKLPWPGRVLEQL